MGNAPLHSPPPSSSHRVVLVITTPTKFGTSLTLLETAQETDVEAENRVLPFALEGGQITADEYYEKLEEMRARLGKWKGGLYMLLLSVYSVFLVFAFIVAYLTPQFWSSAFFDHPGFLYAVIGFQLFLFVFLIAGTKWEFRSMRDDVEELYRPWKEVGVHASMKRVATIGKEREIERRKNKQRAPSGYNCFCVIISVDHDDQGQDDRSIATEQTIGEESVRDTETL